MKRICSLMQGVEFPDASLKGNVKLRVNLRILSETRLIEKPSISCKICGKAHQTHNCWHNKSKRVSAGAEIASSAELYSLNQGGKWQNRGHNLN